MSSANKTTQVTATPLLDFLRIIPTNTEAKKAFNDLVQLQKANKLDEHHARHLHVTGSRPTGLSQSKYGRPSDESSEEYTSDPQQTDEGNESYDGYFRVAFDLPGLTENLKWIIGRGSQTKYQVPNRNVDILLVAPKTPLTKGVAAAHLSLSMNASSGAWMLLTGAEILLDDVCISRDEKVCLSRPQTRLEISQKQWLIKYTIDSCAMENQYIRERDQAIRKAGLRPPPTQLSMIPQDRDVVLRSIVYGGQGLGSGSFAAVFEGFSPVNGNLLAVKRVTVKNADGAAAIRQEVEALERFSRHEGIIDLIAWETLLGDKKLNFEGVPYDVCMVHRKGNSMGSISWNPHDVAWSVKRSLCHQLLAGLREIHQAGYMHRDITPQNIICFRDSEHFEAVLADFGKAIRETVHDDTSLAAWTFLPPELQQGKKHRYDQKLDIWMLAGAMIRSFFPGMRNLSPRSPADYRHVRHELEQDTKSGGLAQLFYRMLSWNPAARPSAAEAYANSCFQGVVQNRTPVDLSDGKRSRQD
ncbi:MAG: hypothetical protein Q9166_005942 [cf. Caloplaca sp. 2 TL-2023]